MIETLVPETQEQQQELTYQKEFQIIQSGEGFHQGLRRDIENAKSSVDVQFYIFEGDEKGIPLIYSLEKAASKGIPVRVIVDHEGWVHHPINTWRSFRYLRRLCKEGLPIDTKFATRRGKAPWRRDHKKNVVIDGNDPQAATAYIGGRNISQRDSMQRDFMVRMQGSLVAGAQDDFDRTWEDRNTTETIYMNEGKNILLSDTKESTGIDESVKSLMKHAKKRIWIQTPYYGRKTLNKTLMDLKSQHPDLDIRVIMPNPKLNNHFVYNVLTRIATSELRKNNIDVYWSEGVFNHSKAMIIDNIAVVGSSNFNQGALTGQDDELELFSPDQEFVKEVELLFERSFSNATIRSKH